MDALNTRGGTPLLRPALRVQAPTLLKADRGGQTPAVAALRLPLVQLDQEGGGAAPFPPPGPGSRCRSARPSRSPGEPERRFGLSSASRGYRAAEDGLSCAAAARVDTPPGQARPRAPERKNLAATRV